MDPALGSFPCGAGHFTLFSSRLSPILSTRCRYGLAGCGTLARAVLYLEIVVWTNIDAYLVAKRNNERYGLR
jgi:hypothetical protein